MKLGLVVLLALCACRSEAEHVTFGATASMRHAMPDLVARYRETGGVAIDVTYASSDRLAELVKQGTAFDGVIVADEVALDQLAVESSRVVATNAIVLVGPAGSQAKFAQLGDGKLVIGDPAHVPVGRYAKQYLGQIGAWEAVQPRLVLGADVTSVLSLAKRNAAAAIVYRTDLVDASPLVSLDEPPGAPVATYSAAIIRGAKHAAAARSFGEFLISREGQEVLARHRFSAPPQR
ncbi:MAG: molybdate ABC transporter substrate-binding protein [Kofleriaceae bacterium]|nr:molybdate ABC transporter substrate-binding protein [Kofleriaceae bacterium]